MRQEIADHIRASARFIPKLFINFVIELIASGEVAQMPYHLNRAMDNGLSRRDTSEVLSSLG